MAKTLLPTTPTGRRFVGLLGGAAALAGSAAALTFAASPASGITNLVVDSNGDAAATPSNCTNGTVGDCTLRDALAAAQDGDTITFDASIGSTITMAPINGQFVIDHAITINGPGRDNLTIDGQYGTRVFYLPSSVTGDVTISGLTITHGDSGIADGAGIYSMAAGNITFSNLGFENNRTTGVGGAFNLFHPADVVIDDVIADDNSADKYAAGYVVAFGTIDAAGFVATNNYSTGGSTALLRGVDSVTVTGSTFDANTTGGGAGGLDIYGGSNTQGSVLVSNSTFSNNSGSQGGLFVSGENCNVVVANSTATGNTATQSGAGMTIRVGGGSSARTATIAQVTVSGNTLNAGQASGLYYGGSGLMLYSTASLADVAITGSIISGNTGAGFHDIDVNGYNTPQDLTITADHSIIGTSGTLVPLTDAGGNSFDVSDPGLNALANNGGATKTMSLKATSPAIDAGPNPVATFPGNQFDQRGTGFARIAFGRSDIGAFEIQEPTPVDPDAPVVPAFTG
jgi:hypothetical protein